MHPKALILLALITLAFAASGALAKDEDHCLNGLGPVLASGRFSGSLDCEQDRLFVRKVGQARGEGRVFAVYDYRYQLEPACNGCAIHGGQRILFMERGRYVGQYKTDGVYVTIRHGNLVLRPKSTQGAPSGPAVVVRITRNGPPPKILVEGEFLEFFQ